MKRLSVSLCKIIAVYLGFLLLALLFVPVTYTGNSNNYSTYVLLPRAFFSGYYVNDVALRLEIVILTIGAAFALAFRSLYWVISTR